MFRIGIFYTNLWFELGFLRSGLFCLGKVRGALVFFVECLMSGFHKKKFLEAFPRQLSIVALGPILHKIINSLPEVWLSKLDNLN